MKYKHITFFLSAILLIILSSLIKTQMVLSQPKLLPIYSVERNDEKIALTFNGSWGEDHTEEILQILREENIKATFFLVGAFVDNNPNKVIEIYENGNEIGGHSNKHPNMLKLNNEQIKNEIVECNKKIEKLTNEKVNLFRSPSGDYNNKIIEIASNIGQYVIQWDVDSVDWRNDGEKVEYDRVINNVKSGSIIQFHLEGKYTVENLKKEIKLLKSRGYKFTTVGDLIYKKNFYINNNGVQILK